MGETKKPPKSDASRDARQARLADALRANLRRRKNQARARKEPDAAASEDAPMRTPIRAGDKPATKDT